MKVAEWSQKLLDPLRDVLAKLSASQRLSLLVLAVTVSIGMGLLVFTGDGATSHAVVANAALNPNATKLLDERQIDYQIDRDGNVTVAASRRDEVYAAGVAEALDTQTDEFDWVFKDQGWQESLGRQRLRSLESTRRRLEKAFAESRDISKAVISVSKPASEDWTLGRNQRAASAAVIITPASPKGISTRQAHMIARTVSGAFRIPLSEIQVSDHEKVYDTANPNAAPGVQSNERELAIIDKVRQHYAEFQPWEIRVSVDVKTDPTARNRVSQRYSEKDSFVLNTEVTTETRETSQPTGLDPGVGRNVSGLNKGTDSQIVPASYRENYKLETARSEPAFSSEKEEVISPAHQERQVNIVVSFSEQAVRNLLRASKARELSDPAGAAQYTPTKEEIKEYIDDRERELRALFSDDKQPNVVHAEKFIAPAPPEIAEAEPVTLASFIMLHLRELVLAVLALCACFLVYRIAFASIPELEQLPDPVAEITQFLKEREEQERQLALARTQAEQERADEGPESEWDLPKQDQETAALLELIAGRAEQEPAAAASVVKQWLRNADREAKS
ncbi:MAG: hypothetical protein AB7O52_05100 [Planctomycetota bacterium]